MDTLIPLIKFILIGLCLLLLVNIVNELNKNQS